MWPILRPLNLRTYEKRTLDHPLHKHLKVHTIEAVCVNSSKENYVAPLLHYFHVSAKPTQLPSRLLPGPSLYTIRPGASLNWVTSTQR